jgi:mannose-1-phosphate guanylyltransferase
VLLGSRSLLRQTLDRAELAIPRERTVIVATRSHESFLETEFGGAPSPEVLVQPLDRGTAAGILLPVQWIAGQDPAATVAVFPSDHFVANDAAFMRHVLRLAGLAAKDLDRIFLVGARPDSAETGYGWIEPGGRLGPPGVRRVIRFWEKPSAQMARVCLTRGCLWNTFVMVGRAEAFLRAARESMPALAGALEPIRPVISPMARERALDRAYASAPTAGFSDSVLAVLPDRLAVSALPASSWSDWGTPERVLQTLRSRGITPDWLDRLATTA